LEAELGITPNGRSEPDFLGWEVKQFGVSSFKSINNSVLTLMTPEPNGGIYVSNGIMKFIENYGYPDKSGKLDRMNFGGIHKCNQRHHLTGLTLHLDGFDSASGKIRNTNGKITLRDDSGNDASTWSFVSLLQHWNRKHNQACYVPSLSQTINGRNYAYADTVLLGSGTDFELFLREMSSGNLYYDPGIKVEHINGKRKIKKRSQFRIKSKFLGHLYHQTEIIPLVKASEIF